jgi:hypothetical protein
MINQAFDVIGGILDKFVEDKDLKQRLQHELQTELHRANLAQIEVNKISAAHRSVWVAGWRPAIGWCAAAGFAYTYVIAPFLQWYLVMQGIEQTLPTVNTDVLFELTLAMLGMAGLRSFEKLKGVTQ